MPFIRRNIETIAQETMTALLQDVMVLAKGDNPMTWDQAATKLDECAQVARIAEKVLNRRQAAAAAQECEPLPTPWRPSCPAVPADQPGPGIPQHVFDFLKDYLASDQPRPHAAQVIAIPAGSNIGMILLNAMVRGAKTR